MPQHQDLLDPSNSGPAHSVREYPCAVSPCDPPKSLGILFAPSIAECEQITQNANKKNHALRLCELEELGDPLLFVNKYMTRLSLTIYIFIVYICILQPKKIIIIIIIT